MRRDFIEALSILHKLTGTVERVLLHIRQYQGLREHENALDKECPHKEEERWIHGIEASTSSTRVFCVLDIWKACNGKQL